MPYYITQKTVTTGRKADIGLLSTAFLNTLSVASDIYKVAEAIQPLHSEEVYSWVNIKYWIFPEYKMPHL